MAFKKIQYDVELLSTETALQAKVPAVYTNDLNSVEFVFNILDMTAEQLAGATATTLLYMRDGSFFQNSDVNLNGNTFTYLLKENEGNHAGLAKIQLVVKVPGMSEQNYPTQLLNFKIVAGLETKVAKSAVEVMIKDWTTLTREAQAYIDQFNLDEVTRQQQFDDAQTERTNIFIQSETERETAFGEDEVTRQQQFDDAQTERTNIFIQSETERETAFEASEELRQAGYDADHGRAGTDHTTAVNDHSIAVADHTTAVADHTTAVADHTLAETDHTTALADHTMVQDFNARLTAEETATANNKISAVKGKTFADVDARFEELETQSIALDAKKANKVQEAWITPTLINGWITGDHELFAPIQYKKDNFGFVHLRGGITNGVSRNICTLPVGYRPEGNVPIMAKKQWSHTFFDWLTLNENGILSISNTSVPADTRIYFYAIFLAEN